MKLVIDNKSKLEVFVAIFQLLKNWNSGIRIQFSEDGLYIQTMDKSHICLSDININSEWFSKYETTENVSICVDSMHFSILMNYALKNDCLELIYTEDDCDKLFVNCLSGPTNGNEKSSFDHFFELSLIDIEQDSFNIPNIEYDVEFTIDSKKIIDSLTDLNTFGSDLNIKCFENVIEMNASSETTKLKIDIPIDDLKEYAVTEEDDNMDVNFSLSHLSKMCTSIKLSQNIEIGISKECPMVLIYNLGNESNVRFYIAPKVSD